MSEFAPLARVSGRGRHPDLDEHGDLRPEAFQDRVRRRFNERYEDLHEHEVLMRELAAEQADWHPLVQHWLAGKDYDAEDHYDGYRQYLREGRELNHYAGRTYGFPAPTERQISRMTPEQFEQWRAGSQDFRLTAGRSVDVQAGMDPYTAAELRRSRSRSEP